jgi:uncharacterized protein with PQ loop repeat
MVYDFLGFIGGFFYAVCFIPQLYSMFCGKNNNDVNIYYIYCQILGASFMISYGTLNQLLPIIILNAFTLFCLLIVLYKLYISTPD